MNYAAHKEVSERAERAKEALQYCEICPRNCGVDRTAGEKGVCKLDDSVYCFREMLYCGEENELNPSHQIHFTGCNLRCEFCVVAEWNENPMAAEEIDFDDMAKIITDRQNKNAKTLNFLGGEPAVNLYGILKLLGRIGPQIKVVWNSNMYYNEIVEKLTTGLIDVYLADFKCGNNECAESLLGAGDYTEIVKDNILKAAKHADVIIRHVIMPGHNRCCLIPILEWLAVKLPDVKLSLRDNYVPPIQVASAPAGYLSQKEMQTAVGLAESMGLNPIK
ncbi:MAG: radical SAM protein [Planctomycetota bacterium]|jgi:putative pyruvate formate lyase activating enzyme